MNAELPACSWCDSPALGYASPDPGFVVESESCGHEGHGFAFRHDSTIIGAYLAARDAEQQRIGAVKALRDAANKAQQAFIDKQAGVKFVRVRVEWLHAEADRIEREGKADER